MLREFYDQLVTNVKDVVEVLKESQKLLFSCSDTEIKNEIATLLQNEVIQLGKRLEEIYGMRNSKVVFLLEKYCEDLYYYVDRGGHQNSFELQNDLGLIIPSICESVRVNDNILSLTTIVKNEAEYLIEWLEYHRMVGVSHFYIYDNESSDNLYQKLKKYIDNDIITYINWPGQAQQLHAYNDALSNYRYETKYMGFIDADEFLVPVLDKSLPDIVEEVFENNNNAGGIGVNWRTYGSSFREKKTTGLVIEKYKYRSANFDRRGANQHIKTVCNPRVTEGFFWNPHQARYFDNYFCVSENGSAILGATFFEGICSKLRINHYYVKSKEEFFLKMKKGKATHIVTYTEEEIESDYEDNMKIFNKVYDPIMDRYIEKLKDRIENDK